MGGKDSPMGMVLELAAEAALIRSHVRRTWCFVRRQGW